MSTFAVIREAGPAWDGARALREQAGWPEHGAFMDALAEDGFVLLGGPLADGRRALLVVDAPTEAEIRRRLGDDPWTSTGLLRIVSAEPWELLLGRDVLAGAGRPLTP